MAAASDWQIHYRGGKLLPFPAIGVRESEVMT